MPATMPANSSESPSIAAFVTARLDEDEAAGKLFEGTTWQAEPSPIGVILVDGEPLIEGHVTGLTEHIARYDPARVLREVAAKRAIVKRYEQAMAGGLPEWKAGREPITVAAAVLFGVIRTFAAVWSDHPDYRQEWAS